MGEQCSKKASVFAKKQSEDEVRQALAWHLRTSPYHELSHEEAENLSSLAEVETWEEAATLCRQSEADEGDGWYARRKKQRMGPKSEQAVEAAAFRMLQSSGMTPGGWEPSRSSRDSGTLAVFNRGGPPTEKVVLTKVQLQACIDSLKRAESAAESACHLCSKASRAFGEEAVCIRSCRDVLESYTQ